MPRKAKPIKVAIEEATNDSMKRLITIQIEARDELFSISDLCAKEKVVPALKQTLEADIQHSISSYIESGKAFLNKAKTQLAAQNPKE
jgi:type 1 glutamine amidotransferase